MDVRLPDGTIINNIPEGTTKAELAAKLSAKGYNLPMDNEPKVETAPQSLSTGEALAKGALNLIPSTGKLIGGAYQAIRHPIQTIDVLSDVGAGAINKILPKPLQEASKKFDIALLGKDKAQEFETRANELANAVGKDYVNKYGSYEGFKKAFAEDPASILADASTILTGGGAALKAGGLAKTAEAVNQAAKYTNPLYVAGKTAQAVSYIPSQFTKGTIGVVTGVGKAPVEETIKAGEANILKGTKTYIENLRNPQRADALDIAKQAVDTLKQNKSQQYRSGMVDVSQDKSILDLSPIDEAISNAKQNFAEYKGVTHNADIAKILDGVQAKVSNWKRLDPAEFHTPEGLDKLKQSIGQDLQKIPFNESDARKAVGQIYNATKDTINSQAPAYAKIMKDYSEASDLIHEIESGLSLKSKAGKINADAAMRKLQSVMRNNVQTNYGQRARLAQELVNAGGTELMPALAGQSMSSVLPRGLGGQIETYGGGAAALMNPSLLFAAPLASPRAMGEVLYKYGQLKGLTKAGANKIPLSVDQANKLGTLLYQMNQNKEQQ
jgi:hypothetical protein